jgi:uncharacterized protein (DUF433 family)
MSTMTAATLKTVTVKLGNRHFTTSEVGAILGMHPTEVNNLIDEVCHLGVTRSGKGVRTVTYRGLFLLLVARELTRCQLKPELRPGTLAEALKAKGKRVAVPGTNLELLLDPLRREVNRGLRAIHEAEAAVASKAGVMGGELCLKGTRIPVHLLGGIAVARGVDEAHATYPFLQRRQVELAYLFVKAHPRKGRPKRISLPVSGRRVVARFVIERKTPVRARASSLSDR